MLRDETYLYTAQDREHLLNGRPVPALTTLLLRVCQNDAELLNEATRLVAIFVEEARRLDSLEAS